MGEKHVKPTKEELQRKMKEADAKADQLKTQPSPSQPAPTPSPSAPAPTPSPSEPIPSSTPSPSQSAPSASPSPSPAPEDDDEVAKAKKKASASAREAQVLHARTKKYDEAVLEAEGIQPPTDEEMISEYGQDEWDKMSEGQKKLARNSWVSDKRFEIMSKVSKEGKDIEKWNESVDKFIDNPKTLIDWPQLERKQEEFKAFASKPTRRGLDMEDLVLAFLGEQAKNAKPKSKGKQMETGSAGKKDRPQPKDDKISAAQGRALRNTNYKEWKRMLKAGKIRKE